MRVFKANFEDTFFVNQNTKEYLLDTKQDPNFDPAVWLNYFTNRNFVCLYGLHGKRQSVGQIWGVMDPITKSFMLSGVFLRRKFRKRIKFLRPLIIAFKDVLRENDIHKVVFVANEATQKMAQKRGFKLDSFLLERKVK